MNLSRAGLEMGHGGQPQSFQHIVGSDSMIQNSRYSLLSEAMDAHLSGSLGALGNMAGVAGMGGNLAGSMAAMFRMAAELGMDLGGIPNPGFRGGLGRVQGRFRKGSGIKP